MPADLTTLSGFLARLEELDGAELVFVTGDTPINPGYHVTELKSSAVNSIDCGRNETQGLETAVQLLDGSQGGDDERMTPENFAKIAHFSASRIPALADGELFFEYAPGNAPMLKWRAGDVDKRSGNIEVSLTEVKAACRPFQLWLEAMGEVPAESAAASCCGPTGAQMQSSSCCG